jgi:hypothetical protein
VFNPLKIQHGTKDFFGYGSFSSTRKTNQKKTPAPRLILRLVDAAGARGNASRLPAGFKQSARF